MIRKPPSEKHSQALAICIFHAEKGDKKAQQILDDWGYYQAIAYVRKLGYTYYGHGYHTP